VSWALGASALERRQDMTVVDEVAYSSGDAETDHPAETEKSPGSGAKVERVSLPVISDDFRPRLRKNDLRRCGGRYLRCRGLSDQRTAWDDPEDDRKKDEELECFGEYR
jgi:hypothetical protein